MKTQEKLENRFTNNPVRSFRMSEEVYTKLIYLSSALQLSPAEFLITKINQEYENLQGNPNLKKVLEIAQAMSKLMEDLRDVNTNLGGVTPPTE